MKTKLAVIGSLSLVLLSAARVVFPALGGLHENIELLTQLYDRLREHPDALALTILLLFVMVLLLSAAVTILHDRARKAEPRKPVPLAGPTRIDKTPLGPGDLEAGLEYCAQAAAKYMPDVIVGVNRGGAIVGGYITRRIHMPLVQLVLAVPEPTGEDRLVFPPQLLMASDGSPITQDAAVNILVVDDSHWSGLHMKQTTEWIRKQYPKARVRTLVLVHLDARRPGASSHGVDDCAFITRDGRCELPWDINNAERARFASEPTEAAA